MYRILLHQRKWEFSSNKDKTLENQILNKETFAFGKAHFRSQSQITPLVEFSFKSKPKLKFFHLFHTNIDKNDIFLLSEKATYIQFSVRVPCFKWKINMLRSTAEIQYEQSYHNN